MTANVLAFFIAQSPQPQKPTSSRQDDGMLAQGRKAVNAIFR
jgi:hypothetical protein